jgi:hypothetical protein
MALKSQPLKIVGMPLPVYTQTYGVLRKYNRGLGLRQDSDEELPTIVIGNSDGVANRVSLIGYGREPRRGRMRLPSSS